MIGGMSHAVPDHGVSSVSEQVSISVPARAEFLSMVRLMVGDLANRLNMSIDEVDDLQLAVDELCIQVIAGEGGNGAMLIVDADASDVAIRVDCRLDGSHAIASSDGADGPLELPASISKQILDALVDAHGRDGDIEHPSAWLTKRKRLDSGRP